MDKWVQDETPVQKKKKLDQDGSGSETIEETQAQRSAAYHLYNVKLLMLYILRGLRHRLTFSLDNEVTYSTVVAADKFDNLVFSYYKIDQTDKKYRILHFQHKIDESKMINPTDLIQVSGGFSVLKYFTKYLKIKNDRCFIGELKDTILCVGNNELNTKVLNSVHQIDSRDDEIFGRKQIYIGKLYKFEKSSEIYEKLVALFQMTHNDISDEEIEDFLNKFILAVKQPNNFQLEEIIKKEIGKEITNDEGGIIYDQFLECMDHWIKQNEVQIIQPKNIQQLFKYFQQSSTHMGIIRNSLMFKFELNHGYKFKNDTKVIKEVKRFLTDKKRANKQILTIFYKSKLLTAMKILQAREHTELYEDVFCDLAFSQELDDTKVSPVEAFKSEACNLLVVFVGEDVSAFSHAKSILRNIIETLSNSVNKRIILLIPQEQQDITGTIVHVLFNILTASVKRNITIQDNDNDFQSLTDESRQKFLEKSKVCFQGQYVSISLMIGDNKELLQADILDKLILNEKFEIGTIPFENSYNKIKDYFVQRTLQRRKHNNQNLITQNDISHHCCVCETQIVEANTKSREHASNVHMNAKDVLYSNERVVIITAPPGMGKSTLLTQLAMISVLDQRNGLEWIIQIDLKKDFKYISKLLIDKKIDTVLCLYTIAFKLENKQVLEIVESQDEFIFYSGNKIELKLFTHFYNSGKVSVFIDAFDEISPIYKKKLLDFIVKLKDTKVQKLWVSTRSSALQNELERRMGVLAYEIVPLNDDEQIFMISRLIEKNISRTQITPERRENIWNKFFKNNNIFLTPLHIKMIATLHEIKILKFLISSNEIGLTNAIKTFTLYDLYDNYLRVKLENMYKIPCMSLIQYEGMKQHLEKNLEIYKYLALLEMFTNEEVKHLIPNEMISINQPKEMNELIEGVIEDRAYFSHRNFAEHLAASLLASMLMDKDCYDSVAKFLYDTLTNENSQASLFFKFLNFKLAANCENSDKLNAVLNGDHGVITDTDNISCIRDPLNRTPLHLAACTFQPTQHNLIFRKDKNDLLDQDSLFGWTPLHYAVIGVCFNSNNNDFSSLKQIKLHGVNIQDKYGRTPLMIAVKLQCHEQYISLMSARQCNVNIADNDGKTAFDYVAENRANTIKYLADEYFARVEIILLEARKRLSPHALKPTHEIFDTSSIAMHIRLKSGQMTTEMPEQNISRVTSLCSEKDVIGKHAAVTRKPTQQKKQSDVFRKKSTKAPHDHMNDGPSSSGIKNLVIEDVVKQSSDLSKKSTRPPIKESVETPIRSNVHGIMYQVNLLILVLIQAHKLDQPFWLGTEVPGAENFADVVIYTHSQEGMGYRLLQTKFKTNDTKPIKTSDLLSGTNTDFSMLKYFNSYKKIARNKQFHGNVKDLIIYTNIDVDSVVRESLIEIDSGADIILFHKQRNTSKHYKFKKHSKLYEVITNKFIDSFINRLAVSAARMMANQNFAENPLIRRYAGWLLENVLTIVLENDKRYIIFKDSFVNTERGEDDMLETFRIALKKSYENIQVIDDFDKVLQNTKIEIQKTLLIKTKDTGLLNGDIDSFFEKLVLAVNQPTESELWQIILNDVNDNNTNEIYAGFQATILLKKVMEWIQEPKSRFLTLNDIKNIFVSVEQQLAFIKDADKLSRVKRRLNF